MITGATKNKVDDIWQKMWEGGITNPLEVISQLTYLMFMHQLDERVGASCPVSIVQHPLTAVCLFQPSALTGGAFYRLRLHMRRLRA